HFHLMTPHRVGIIGGSGLYHIEGFSKQKWKKVTTPFGPPSDSFLTGELAGRPVVFLPRHSRGHRILPSELNHRANIWALKNLGEAKCAREAEIAYATMAMVTDYDCWKVDEAHVTVEMVIANLQRNAAQAKEIVRRVVPRIPQEPGCSCHRALDAAILTDKKL